jgi:hypothetical protein
MAFLISFAEALDECLSYFPNQLPETLAEIEENVAQNEDE